MNSHSVEEQEEIIAPTSTNASIGFTRFLSIDAIRGIALLGILLISIWEFGGFSTNEQTRLLLLEKGKNYHLFQSILFLFEGKMRALFSLIFGVGMILYMQKPNMLGMPSTQELYIRRQMWLIAFGLINAFVFLWPGDILFQYGIMGILLFPFFRMSRKGLLIAAIVLTIFYCGKLYWNYADDADAYKKFKAVAVVETRIKNDSAIRHQKDSMLGLAKEIITKNDSIARKKDTLTSEQKKDKGAWEGLVKSLKYDSTNASVKAENKKMWAGYSKVWNSLLTRSQDKEASWLYRIGIFDIGSMMLLGMALFGFGFFGSSFSKSKYLIIAVIGISTGLLLAWLRVEWQHYKLLDYAKYIEHKVVDPYQFFPIERLLMALGYASLLMLLIQSKVLNGFCKALAAVGKMAFTNYFMQTIICTIFFYGYGFGYFGRLSQIQLYLFVAEIWLVQIVYSIFWLRFFEYGPVEWLWRCLIIRKRISNRKVTNLN